MRSLFKSTVAAALVTISLVAGDVQAQTGPYVWSNRFGYTGTISRFTSLSNAQANTGAVAGSPFAVPQRDLGLFLVSDNTGFAGFPAFPPSAFDFLTNWYSDPSGPSNQNTGFVQISDEDAGSVTSAIGYWTDGTRTEFVYRASGANTEAGCDVYTPFITVDCPRLWNAGSPVGSAETTYGTFLSYDFALDASGLDPAVFNAGTGVYESVSEPGSVNGYFRGIFQNLSTDDPGSNGFYRVDLSFNMNSASFAEGLTGPSYFGASTVAPEPATWALMAFGLAGISAFARRRRAKS